MSIYFQYKAIDEYPIMINTLQASIEVEIIKDEDMLQVKAAEHEQLKDYLTLKTV